jgi:hypothetical protein
MWSWALSELESELTVLARIISDLAVNQVQKGEYNKD